jgi:hypothetical protein
MLTQQQLKELLSYDANNGDFVWLVQRGRKKAGELAGVKDHYGYVVIRIDTKLYKAHRLAWLYTHGEWPINGLDHINRDRADNRIENLRDVSHSANMHNAKVRCGSKSGFAGVRWRPERNRWVASIKLGYRHYNLGSFQSFDEAVDARRDAEKRMLRAVLTKGVGHGFS